MLFIKVLLIAILAVIFYQDYSSRMVSRLLFPLAAVCFGVLHFMHADTRGFLLSTGTNMAFIAIVLLVLYLYSVLKLKTRFINGSFGMGDLWFFIAAGFGFPTVSFVVLFVFSVLFSLLLHLFLKQRIVVISVSQLKKQEVSSENKEENHFSGETVPLAGYMSLFFALILTISVFCNFPSLYLV